MSWREAQMVTTGSPSAGILTVDATKSSPAEMKIKFQILASINDS